MTEIVQHQISALCCGSVVIAFVGFCMQIKDCWSLRGCKRKRNASFTKDVPLRVQCLHYHELITPYTLQWQLLLKATNYPLPLQHPFLY